MLQVSPADGVVFVFVFILSVCPSRNRKSTCKNTAHPHVFVFRVCRFVVVHVLSDTPPYMYQIHSKKKSFLLLQQCTYYLNRLSIFRHYKLTVPAKLGKLQELYALGGTLLVNLHTQATRTSMVMVYQVALSFSQLASTRTLTLSYMQPARTHANTYISIY